MTLAEPGTLAIDPRLLRTDAELGALQRRYRRLVENGQYREADEILRRILFKPVPHLP